MTSQDRVRTRDEVGADRATDLRAERYLPIAEHGLIGEFHTVALVGTDGTVDWYCCPRFDSRRVFGALLDADGGGHYRLRPAVDGWTTKRSTSPDTNVLITRFLSAKRVGQGTRARGR